jgi:hypothetical protein
MAGSARGPRPGSRGLKSGQSAGRPGGQRLDRPPGTGLAAWPAGPSRIRPESPDPRPGHRAPVVALTGSHSRARGRLAIRIPSGQLRGCVIGLGGGKTGPEWPGRPATAQGDTGSHRSGNRLATTPLRSRRRAKPAGGACDRPAETTTTTGRCGRQGKCARRPEGGMTAADRRGRPESVLRWRRWGRIRPGLGKVADKVNVPGDRVAGSRPRLAACTGEGCWWSAFLGSC